MNYPNLSLWQVIKRRFCLFSHGSYTHPDGLIEGDFHDKAGIHIYLDEQSVQDEKLKQYYQAKNKANSFGNHLLMVQLQWQYLLSLLKDFRCKGVI